jgi:hypothetical protein
MPAQSEECPRKPVFQRAKRIPCAQTGFCPRRTGAGPRKPENRRAKRISSAQKCRHPAPSGFSRRKAERLHGWLRKGKGLITPGINETSTGRSAASFSSSACNLETSQGSGGGRRGPQFAAGRWVVDGSVEITAKLGHAGDVRVVRVAEAAGACARPPARAGRAQPFPPSPVFPALRLTESRAVFPADQDSTRSIRFTKRWARSRTTGFRRAGLNPLLA